MEITEDDSIIDTNQYSTLRYSESINSDSLVKSSKELVNSSIEDISNTILNILKTRKGVAFSLASKLNSMTRGKNIVALTAEVLSNITMIPLQNIMLGLRNKELMAYIINLKFNFLDGVYNSLGGEVVDTRLAALLGGEISFMDDGEGKIKKSVKFKLNQKVIDSMLSNNNMPVGSEITDSVQIPIGFPEIYEAKMDESFEILKANLKLKIEKEFTESQVDVWQKYRRSKRVFHILDGCVRAGKSYVATYLALLEIEEHINSGKEGQIVFIGVSANSCYTNIFKGIMCDLFGIEDIPPARSYDWKLQNLKIKIIGSNRAAMRSLRGITAKRIFIDEAQNVITDEYVKDSIESRIAGKDVKVIMTCNTSNPSHIMHDKYLKDPDKHEQLSVQRYHFDLEKEVARGHPFVTKEFVERYKHHYGEDSSIYKRSIKGLWVAADESIYLINEDRDIYHQRSEINYGKYDEFFVGVDQGTNSPRVYILIGTYVDKNGKMRVNVIDELYYEKGHGHVKKHADYKRDLAYFLNPVLDKLTAIYTPHDANDLKLLLNHEGYPAQMCNRKLGVEEGIRVIQDLFGAGLLKVSSRCKNLIRELYGYKYEVKDGESVDKIDKRHDHAPDALRYALTSCGVFCSSDKERYDWLEDID